MKRLLALLAVVLAGCAVQVPSQLQADVAALNSGDLDAAIRAAKPGVPRHGR
jgi:hypothetical protein